MSDSKQLYEPSARVSTVSPRKRPRKPSLGRFGAVISGRLGRKTPKLHNLGPFRDTTFFGLLLLLLFVIYNSNFRTIRWDDTLPARCLPFSILLDHSFSLDHWIEPRVGKPPGRYGLYFATASHGHWMSAYPLITPVVVTPLYVLPAWWLAHHTPPLYPYSLAFILIADTMEKLSASLIAAASAALLFLAFRRITSRKVSLALALIYGLTSNTWAISSQALWRHGLTELSYALLLWALFHFPGLPSAPFWAGLGLALAAANKPLEAILILPFVLYFGRAGRKNLLLFLAPLAAIGSLVFAYNLYFFGRPLGGYPSLSLAGETGGHFPILTRFVVGLFGSFVSPSRGLFVYTPWTVFAIWGAARLWKENSPSWVRPLIVAMAATLVTQVGGGDWWGGWCFGPRYLADRLPFLTWFLVPVLTSILARRRLRLVFVATVAIALWVQVVGAFYYPAGNWDGRPVNVSFEPKRCWDWSDTQLLRSWRAGPAPPLLLDEWERWLQS